MDRALLDSTRWPPRWRARPEEGHGSRSHHHHRRSSSCSSSFAIGIYNSLVQKRLRIDEAFAQIEVQLKRRHDLIPNLVNAVKGYMGFEQKVLTDVTNARAAAVAAGAQGPAQQAAAENALTGTLRSLFAVVENYPELKANQNVLELQEQLTTTENQISFSRQHYNATVLDYNTCDRHVPEHAARRTASGSRSGSSSTPNPRPRTSRTWISA